MRIPKYPTQSDTGLFRVAEATRLALHAALLLSGADTRRSVGWLADRLQVSWAHLAKVLQRLEHSGLVVGTRGPAGGYQLARPARNIMLADIIRAMHPDIGFEKCPFTVPVCDGTGCALGHFFASINQQIAESLENTRLTDLQLNIGVNDEACP